MADASLLATLISEKYCDHLPVYRQMTRFDRTGIKLAPSTLLDWIAKTCTLLNPLYEKLKQEVLQSNYLMMDETTMKVMDKSKKGKPTVDISGRHRHPRLNSYSLTISRGATRKCRRKCCQLTKGTFKVTGTAAMKRLRRTRISLCYVAWHMPEDISWNQIKMIQKGSHMH